MSQSEIGEFVALLFQYKKMLADTTGRQFAKIFDHYMSPLRKRLESKSTTATPADGEQSKLNIYETIRSKTLENFNKYINQKLDSVMAELLRSNEHSIGRLMERLPAQIIAEIDEKLEPIEMEFHREMIALKQRVAERKTEREIFRNNIRDESIKNAKTMNIMQSQLIEKIRNIVDSNF